MKGNTNQSLKPTSYYMQINKNTDTVCFVEQQITSPRTLTRYGTGCKICIGWKEVKKNGTGSSVDSTAAWLNFVSVNVVAF